MGGFVIVGVDACIDPRADASIRPYTAKIPANLLAFSTISGYNTSRIVCLFAHTIQNISEVYQYEGTYGHYYGA